MTIREQIALARQQHELTVEQYALLAQFSPRTVYKQIRRGAVPGVVRVGRSIRIVREVAFPSS